MPYNVVGHLPYKRLFGHPEVFAKIEYLGQNSQIFRNAFFPAQQFSLQRSFDGKNNFARFPRLELAGRVRAKSHRAMQTSRRSALKTAASTVALTGAASFAAAAGDYYVAKNGRINQSVVTWNFKPLSVADLARWSVKFGVKSVELVKSEEHTSELQSH